MKNYAWYILLIAVCAGVGVWYAFFGPRQSSSVLSPITQVMERNLDKYTIDNLSKRQGMAGQIVLEEAIATASAYTVYRFHFLSGGKTVTGLAHIPLDTDESHPHPVVVQIRGYVDHSVYEPGMGTKRSAEVFAQQGMISLAPDFLGYGNSDNPSADVFEERFQTYVVVLDLLASASSLPGADASRVGLWAHSNGGQIALTVLEITKGTYPTVLWAPVTRAFPYSILYYTDEADDKGKALRKKLSEFERDYDVDLYTMVNYTDRIAAPLQIHQGDADEAVPEKWSKEFVAMLKTHDADVEYFVYPGADHNLQPGWSTAMNRSLEFYRRHGIQDVQ